MLDINLVTAAVRFQPYLLTIQHASQKVPYNYSPKIVSYQQLYLLDSFRNNF